MLMCNLLLVRFNFDYFSLSSTKKTFIHPHSYLVSSSHNPQSQSISICSCSSQTITPRNLYCRNFNQPLLISILSHFYTLSFTISIHSKANHLQFHTPRKQFSQTSAVSMQHKFKFNNKLSHKATILQYKWFRVQGLGLKTSPSFM